MKTSIRHTTGAALAAAAFLQACGGDPCAAGKSVFTGQWHPGCTAGALGGTPTTGTTFSPVASSGNGDAVVPAGAGAVEITATTAATSDNFIVHIGGQLAVNEIVGTTSPTFSGSYAATAGETITVATSSTTRWTVTGLALATPGAGSFSAAGLGDRAFTLPARTARYRVTAQYTGNSQNFIFKAGGTLLVNELLGTSHGLTRYENTFTAAGGTATVEGSGGVAWSVVETTP